jgi:hypothetical protein
MQLRNREQENKLTPLMPRNPVNFREADQR